MQIEWLRGLGVSGINLDADSASNLNPSADPSGGGAVSAADAKSPSAPARKPAEITAEFEKVYASTSAAATDAWLDALDKEAAGNAELQKLAAALRDKVVKRRAARAARAAKNAPADPKAAPPAVPAAPPKPAPAAPPKTTPPAPPESEGLLDEVEEVAGRAVNRVKGLANEAVASARSAWNRLTADDEPAPAAGGAKPAATAADPKAKTRDPSAPKFKGYPTGLEKAEKLIDQVKEYGFDEGIEATSPDAAERGDTKEIWCSGLSNWSLLESGIDVDEKHKYATGAMKKDKNGKLVPEEKKISIRAVVEGGYQTWGGTPPELDPLPTAKDYPDPKELKAKIAETKAKNKAAAVAANEAAYKKEGLFGETAAEDDPRVKGAAGAFVITGIGTEITDLKDVKPGDYVQTREYQSPKGHAFQIHACECEGEALIGPAGSPKLLKDLGGDRIKTPDGIWYAKASFKIDGKSDPEYVGKHEVVKTDILESNVPDAMEDKKKHPDGGVQIRHSQEFAKPKKCGKRTYVGRLGTSSWAGYVRTAPLLVRPEGEPMPKGG